MTSRAVEASRAVLKSIDLSAGYDPEQTRLMEERCILVDEDDNALGAADKKTCAFFSSASFSLFSDTMIPRRPRCAQAT